MNSTARIIAALTMVTSLACVDGVDDFETSDELEQTLADADESSELPPTVIAGGRIDNWGHASVGYLQYNGAIFCSGQQITPTIFLTAAHCVKAMKDSGIPITDFYVGYGPESANLKVRAKAMAMHPKYDGEVTNPYDLGVVAMSAPIGGIPSATIGTASVGDRVTIVGYGNNDDGVEDLRKSGDSWVVRRTQTGGFELGSGSARTCRGDSGGAAMRRGVQNELLVVTSYGPSWGCNTWGLTGHVDPRLADNVSFLQYVGATFK
jgi:V8-like Glu-specific endopeptidase